MDNFITLYLIDIKRDIETQHKTSDNKAYHIRTDKAAVINDLILRKRSHTTLQVRVIIRSLH